MDYKKKFEDFLDKMQGLLDSAKKQGHIIVRVEDIENTFPELKESEDEKIRKGIIRCVKGNMPDNDSRKKYIAWLEKQYQKETTWNKEDEKNVNNILYVFNQLKGTSSYKEDNTAEKTIKWVKSLKDRLYSSNEYDKNMLGAIKYCTNNNRQLEKEHIAWLEKQEGCEHIRKDWLEHIKQSWYKEGFIDGKYSGVTSKELSTNDAVTLKELIDFLENGTAKLQHDLTRYANWLKIKFTPIEKQGKQKPAEWSEEDEEMIDEIIDYMKPMPIFFESTKGKSGKEYTKEFIKNATKWLSRLKYRVQLQKNLIATDEEFVQAKKDAYNDALD